MIEVQNLTKHYGPVTAIRDVSFSVAPGEIVGFLGPNGAGKSTTMRILSCFMPASGGTARVAGFDVFRDSMEVRRRIGYLPENVPLYSDMRVAPYLDFVAEIKGVARGERRRRVADAMDRCRIADVQNRLIGTLSKGYRQRVGLAQAIVSDPHVLILDEPTIGLDPRQITEIRDLIKALAGRAPRGLPARRPAAVGPARAAARRHDARGGLHPHRGRRGERSMRVWPIFKKEMRLYFTSPVAWVIMSVFLFIAGYFFYSIFGYYTRLSMQSAMNPMAGGSMNVTDGVLRPLFSDFSGILLPL